LDFSIKLWNVNTGMLINTLSGHTGFVYSVAFSPDGTKLASGSGDKTIKLWNVSTEALLKTIEFDKGGSPNSLCFNNNGNKIAVGGGEKNYLRIYDVTINGVSDNRNIIPISFILSQSYPNPFNPSTVISYQLPVNSFVTLKIYNSLGQEVKTLIEKIQLAGRYTIEWNPGNQPSGIYYYRLQAGKYSEMKKMVFIR
jgi:WD40 repeat protein